SIFLSMHNLSVCLAAFHNTKNRIKYSIKPIFDSQRRFLLGRCSSGAASRAIKVPGRRKCSAIYFPKMFFQVALVEDLWLLAVELNNHHVFSEQASRFL